MKYLPNIILENLHAMSEDSFQEFSSGLMGVPVKMLGVRLPKLRAFAKEIAKEDGFEYLDHTILSLDASYMEEIMLYGMVIGNTKASLDVLFPYITKYVALIDNWSTCDSFCCGLKQTKKEPDIMWQFLQPYLHSDKEYELRFGIVMLMDYYVQPDYIDRILEIYNAIHHDGYYVKMAVAWALSVCFVKCWNQTFSYMKSSDNQLDNFTYNKALQKCRESYRISDEQKEILQKMKRK